MPAELECVIRSEEVTHGVSRGGAAAEVRLQSILGMPASIVPIGVLMLGYSAEEPLAPEVRQRFRTRRRPSSEVIHREQW